MPASPEYVSFADTEEEAVALTQEGIAFELERLRKWSEAVPTRSRVR